MVILADTRLLNKWVRRKITPPRRKRKRAGDESNEFLPNGPSDEAASIGNLSFNETLDEEVASFSSRYLTRVDVKWYLSS